MVVNNAGINCVSIRPLKGDGIGVVNSYDLPSLSVVSMRFRAISRGGLCGCGRQGGHHHIQSPVPNLKAGKKGAVRATFLRL